jgi:hypothetical protein
MHTLLGMSKIGVLALSSLFHFFKGRVKKHHVFPRFSVPWEKKNRKVFPEPTRGEQREREREGPRLNFLPARELSVGVNFFSQSIVLGFKIT